MKIHSKRARIWIILGLLSLIDLLIYPIFSNIFGYLLGSIGKILGNIFRDIGFILIFIGYYIESKHKKDSLKNIRT